MKENSDVFSSLQFRSRVNQCVIGFLHQTTNPSANGIIRNSVGKPLGQLVRSDDNDHYLPSDLALSSASTSFLAQWHFCYQPDHHRGLPYSLGLATNHSRNNCRSHRYSKVTVDRLIACYLHDLAVDLHFGLLPEVPGRAAILGLCFFDRLHHPRDNATRLVCLQNFRRRWPRRSCQLADFGRDVHSYLGGWLYPAIVPLANFGLMPRQTVSSPRLFIFLSSPFPSPHLFSEFPSPISEKG